MEAIAVGAAVCFILGAVAICVVLALAIKAYARGDRFGIQIRAWPPSLQFQTDGRGESITTHTPGGEVHEDIDPKPKDVEIPPVELPRPITVEFPLG